ncbi:helix-turn-helix and ligand-binding sensor domain-containing protein [Flagellimonas halotolerans]|uniref:Triple tyrosine motif-containing protein n=1 Tax=Flagellimonas halotolerans TaxID=3112164 RepID=A0ABU6INQ0_9FLAO|nr:MULTISPECIES: triple tyrosine motif-containing protein [unclassified Allomuricauda]MEC3965005.1 triple tyrosine motif-containing protein [Muricauda sp. SYSU M86414]MEC4264633.1 triple tyrosine motif-containing protein [Muricauda sp. SYSU M84420]
MRPHIFYFLLFFCFTLVGQELPPIRNYTPKEYSGEFQNWGITQSPSKNIYVANHTSLMEFDGSKWHQYKLPTSPIIRSVKAVGDKIYTGSYREFGFWTKKANGELTYTSLSQKMEIPMAEDEEFWDILVVDQWILFQSLDRIYIYDSAEDTFKVINANSEKANLSIVNGDVYFQIARKGLFTIQNGKPKLVSHNQVFMDQPIIGLYTMGNDLLVITEGSRFYKYNSEAIIPWKTAMDSINVKLYSSIQLKDGSFVLGSISNGFYHLSPNGQTIIRNIDQEKGLNNNTVLTLFEDSENNLWLGLDNGISVVNLYSPFNEYVDKLGNLGLVYAALSHKGYLYLGTNQGLFYRKTGSEDAFRIIDGTEGQVWNIQLVDSTIFCGHNNGTFVVENNLAELISDFPGTWGVKPIQNRKNLLLQGNYNGLSILEKVQGSWRFRNTIDGYTISSRFFEMDSLEVVVDHEKKGLYFIELEPNLREVKQVTNKERIGHSSNIFSFQDKLYYKTNTGIYNIDGENNIVLDSTLTQLILDENDGQVSIIIPESSEQRLWFFTNDGIQYVTQSTLSNKLSASHISIPKDIRANLGVSGFENISKISDYTYLIGSSNGYVSLDLTRVEPTNQQVHINSVYYGDYQEVSSKASIDTTGTFKYSNNNVRLEFSVPEFDKYTEVKYQYKMDNVYDDWSEWSENTDATFKNLSFGDYTFTVRAMIGSTMSENTSSYSFSISRPWYLSNLALILYMLSIALLFVLVHRLYNNYYQKKQESLIKRNKKELERRELEEKERIAKIQTEKLQNEIDSKNRELAISTMSLVKKNKFLSALKAQLREVPSKDKNIKYVIKEIDRNINSEDDWKFFEDAFNNADKDFLKRIKTKHDSLTNNDLRLCAYLRLNLSSKEIAPLLNISVKSVEMKRYRLRKKFNLPHHDNLIDYILNF